MKKLSPEMERVLGLLKKERHWRSAFYFGTTELTLNALVRRGLAEQNQKPDWAEYRAKGD